MIRISIFTILLVLLSAGAFAQIDAEMQARIDALKAPIEAAPSSPSPVLLEAIEEIESPEDEAVVSNAPAGRSALTLKFEDGQSNLSEDQQKELLEAVLAGLGQNTRVQVLSYAHEQGLNDNQKRRLALERALSARKVLVDHGVSYRVVDLLPKIGAAAQNTLIVTLRN